MQLPTKEKSLNDRILCGDEPGNNKSFPWVSSWGYGTTSYKIPRNNVKLQDLQTEKNKTAT